MMQSNQKEIRRLLTKLQGAVRAERNNSGPYGRTGVVPDDLIKDGITSIHVGVSIATQITKTVEALLCDLQFEHLGQSADKEVWSFVCRGALERNMDHVNAFLVKHHKEPQNVSIRFGIEHLAVGREFTLAGVEFLPLPEGDSDDDRFLRSEENCGCVVRVATQGTAFDQMVMRGRRLAEHGVRILRISLAERRMLDKSQLGFRVGRNYVVEDRGRGFRRHRDAPIMLELPKPPQELLAGFGPLSIASDAANRMQRQALLALKWLDEAQTATEPYHQIAFIFAALEAMLGDSSGALKSRPLVFYRTTLGQAVRGFFPDPRRLYYLYDKVRSYVVHGEYPNFFTSDDVQYLEWNVREALFELVDFYETHELKDRSAVRAALRSEAERSNTLQWLRAGDPVSWPESWSPVSESRA